MNSKLSTIVILIMMSFQLFGQAPIVYINFVSHNEPKDSLHKSFEYFQSKTKCIQLANIIADKNAAWNLGTCDYFIDGAINHDNAVANTNDIFETLSGSAYNSFIEIDPRTKNHLGRNTADAASIINSCGGVASKNLSGFTYYSSTLSQIDWFNYQDTITGNITGYKWKANILWGAGSIPAHSNDIDDWGVWKPDTLGTNITNIQSNFYNHNSSRNLWYIGNGCLSKLDTLSDEQATISLLRNFIDSIQNNQLPQNKFYSATITLGQDEFGTTLFNKISTICDSINSWGSSKIQWATLTQKFTAFQNWQNSSGLTHSQWLCGQSTTEINEFQDNHFTLFPNPSTGLFEVDIKDNQKHNLTIFSIYGQEVMSLIINKNEVIDLRLFPPGIYIGLLDNQKTIKLVKQ